MKKKTIKVKAVKKLAQSVFHLFRQSKGREWKVPRFELSAEFDNITRRLENRKILEVCFLPSKSFLHNYFFYSPNSHPLGIVNVNLFRKIYG